MTELRKFLVVLRPGSGAAELMADDMDARMNGMAALTCSDFVMGDHAMVRVRRIPAPTGQAATSRLPELWYFHTSDVAGVFEYTSNSQPLGFVHPPPL